MRNFLNVVNVKILTDVKSHDLSWLKNIISVFKLPT